MRDTGRVPAEFVGRARAFWQRVDVVATETTRIRKASVRRCAQLFKNRPGKGYRPEHLVELENLWRTLPEFGRLLPLEVTKKPKHLTLRSCRLMTTETTMESWIGAAELDLVLFQFGLDVDPKAANHNGGPLVVVSNHALARRFQRGFGIADDQAFEIDALSLLAHFKLRCVTGDQIGQKFSVLVPKIGEWRGEIRRFVVGDRSFVVLDTRTFV